MGTWSSASVLPCCSIPWFLSICRGQSGWWLTSWQQGTCWSTCPCSRLDPGPSLWCKVTSGPFRGSRKHVLDWVRSPTFLDEFNEILTPTGVQVSATDLWMPTGSPDKVGTEEARLERFLPNRAFRREL